MEDCIDSFKTYTLINLITCFFIIIRDGGSITIIGVDGSLTHGAHAHIRDKRTVHQIY